MATEENSFLRVFIVLFTIHALPKMTKNKKIVADLFLRLIYKFS